MVSLLISLVVLMLVLGLVWWVITLIPLPYPFGLVAQVALAIVAVLIVIEWLLPMAHVGSGPYLVH